MTLPKQQFRWTREERKAALLDAAMDITVEHGFDKVAPLAVAKRANVAKSLVHFYFKNMENLKVEMLKKAIEEQVYPVIGRAILAHHPLALRLPRETRDLAMNDMCGI